MWNWVIFAAGVLVTVIAAAYAISEQNAARTMPSDWGSWDPVALAQHTINAQNGWTAAGIGVVITIVGAIVGAIGELRDSQQPTYYPLPPSQLIYYSSPPQPAFAYGQTATARIQSCPYCRVPLAYATQSQCENCGRLIPWNIAADEPQPPAPSNVKASGTKFCRYCGKKILADSIYCQHCGRAT